MKYEITGSSLPVVVVTLEKGETIHSERGAITLSLQSTTILCGFTLDNIPRLDAISEIFEVI